MDILRILVHSVFLGISKNIIFTIYQLIILDI